MGSLGPARTGHDRRGGRGGAVAALAQGAGQISAPGRPSRYRTLPRSRRAHGRSCERRSPGQRQGRSASRLLTVVPASSRLEEESKQKEVRWCVLAGRPRRSSTPMSAAAVARARGLSRPLEAAGDAPACGAWGGGRRRSHTSTASSFLAPVASSLPSGENVRWFTPPLWPASVATKSPLRWSNSPTVQSWDPQAYRPLPSGLAAMASGATPPLRPRRLLTSGLCAMGLPGLDTSNTCTPPGPAPSSRAPPQRNARQRTSAKVSPSENGT